MELNIKNVVNKVLILFIFIFIINTLNAQDNVVINEIMYSTVYNDSTNEWVELYNFGNNTVDLYNWTICNESLIDGYINFTDNVTYNKNGYLLYPNEFAIITNGDFGTEVYDNFKVRNNTLSLYVNSSDICSGLANTGGQVTLENDGFNMDTVIYTATYANGNNFSLEKVDPFSNATFFDNWNESLVMGGTPGDYNSIMYKKFLFLRYPFKNETIGTNFIEFKFESYLNNTLNCTLYTDITGTWYPINDTIGNGNMSINVSGLSNGTYEWNVYCEEVGQPQNHEWGDFEKNWSFVVDTGYIPSNCSIYSDFNSCMVNSCLWQFNMSSLSYICTDSPLTDYCEPYYGNYEGCVNETANYGCFWIQNSSDCMPVDGDCSTYNDITCEDHVGCFYNYTNSSCVGLNTIDQNAMNYTQNSCYIFDEQNGGNESACEANSCIWHIDGNSIGWCDPIYNFTNNDCYLYDGDKDACKYAQDIFSMACTWQPDIFGPLVNGTERGYCNNLFGSNLGCWDYMDNLSCSNAASQGLPCIWKLPPPNGWCEKKECFDYQTQTDCNLHASESCTWKPTLNICKKVNCIDLVTQIGCNNAMTNYNLDCSWDTSGFIDKCVENSCFDYDWNQTGCEENPKCSWEAPWCNEKGCFDFVNETSCNTGVSGLSCVWRTDSTGWCEQKECYSYDNTNQTACENLTQSIGLSCLWDNANNVCYEKIKECHDYNNNSLGCFNTNYCNWNPINSTCSEPQINLSNLINPGCFIFTNAGESKCEALGTTCYWDNSTSKCKDNTTSSKGIQCSNIIDSNVCSNIPVLSTCCSWDSGVCKDAPYTTSCWDNIQEPPEGANFCDDYNAKYNKAVCEQISADPWYMPCKWDSIKSECRFTFEDLFVNKTDEFNFDNIVSQSNCEAVGGVWRVEKWYSDDGTLNTDKWCEFNFGTETCDNACWACEKQNNGSNWLVLENARAACENSNLGVCKFIEDNNSPNGFGWCDINVEKTGNCDENCFECFDELSCSNSASNDCKWVSDPFNLNNSWCTKKSVKTCDESCFECFDYNSCNVSSASCTWDQSLNFCKPKGIGTGSTYEVCFDGVDNDADNFVDCADSDCMFDEVCGGFAIYGTNCQIIQNENTCVSQNCSWITDEWNNSWCDMPGSECSFYHENKSSCNLDTNCKYQNLSNFNLGLGAYVCGINETKANSAQCFNYFNETSCNNSTLCLWVQDPFNPNNGWCENDLWTCDQYTNVSECDSKQFCSWVQDPFNPNNGGWCDMTCVSYKNNLSLCNANDYCQVVSTDSIGWCEAKDTFRGCVEYLDNNTCQQNNACVWIDNDKGGYCSDKFLYSMIEDMDQSYPLILGNRECNVSNSSNSNVKLCNVEMKDEENNFAIGVGVLNINNSAVCSKYYTGSQNRSSKYYWYIDTDGNPSKGCSANNNLSNLTGFEFKFKYESIFENGVISEKKVAYKCLNNSWSASKIKLNTWPDMMCNDMNNGQGGVMIVLDKEDLQKLTGLQLFNRTADIRIYATSAGKNDTEKKPYDEIGPLWYSFGSADFKFEECLGFADNDGDGLLPSEDPDCSDYYRYGYVDMEKGSECSDNIDNDGNGLIDCLDLSCMFDTYYCNATNISDITAPKILWLDSKEFTNGAFIQIDTNEPTNATLLFYKNNSFCKNTTGQYNILDWKLENNFTLDDYDTWHGIMVDQEYFDSKSIAYNIAKNKTYYYKLKMCDKAGNCALSACSSFKTKSQTSEFVVGFNLPAPKSNESEYLGKVNVKFDWDKQGNFNDSITSNAGYKINETKGKDVNIRFTNPNSSKKWNIDLIGADFVKAQSINISDAFIVNETNGQVFVGMKKSKWKKLAQNLGVDYVKVEMPSNITNSSLAVIKHCPDNVLDVNDSRCVVINMSDVSCIFTQNSTICEIPTNIGFSVFAAYMVQTVTSGDNDGGQPQGSSSSSSSSSGGSSSSSSGGSSSGGGSSSSGSGYVPPSSATTDTTQNDNSVTDNSVSTTDNNVNDNSQSEAQNTFTTEEISLATKFIPSDSIENIEIVNNIQNVSDKQIQEQISIISNMDDFSQEDISQILIVESKEIKYNGGKVDSNTIEKIASKYNEQLNNATLTEEINLSEQLVFGKIKLQNGSEVYFSKVRKKVLRGNYIEVLNKIIVPTTKDILGDYEVVEEDPIIRFADIESIEYTVISQNEITQDTLSENTVTLAENKEDIIATNEESSGVKSSTVITMFIVFIVVVCFLAYYFISTVKEENKSNDNKDSLIKKENREGKKKNKSKEE